MAEVPLPYAKELETAALPNEDRIEAAVLATLGRARMTDVIMPRLSDSMEEGTILKWLKASGEEVTRRRADRRDRDRQGDDDLRGRRRRLPADRRRRGRHARDRRRDRALLATADEARGRARRGAPAAAERRAAGRRRPSRGRRRTASRAGRRASRRRSRAGREPAEPRAGRRRGRRAGASRRRRSRAGSPRELGVDLASSPAAGPRGAIVKADVMAAGERRARRARPPAPRRRRAGDAGGAKGAVAGRSSRPGRSS